MDGFLNKLRQLKQALALDKFFEAISEHRFHSPSSSGDWQKCKGCYFKLPRPDQSSQYSSNVWNNATQNTPPLNYNSKNTTWINTSGFWFLIYIFMFAKKDSLNTGGLGLSQTLFSSPQRSCIKLSKPEENNAASLVTFTTSWINISSY